MDSRSSTTFNNIQSFTTYNTPRFRYAVRFTIGLIIGGVGLAEMVSPIIPRLKEDFLLGTWSLDAHHSGHGINVAIGFFLLMLCCGLMRGKRHVWRLTILLLLASAFLHVLHRDALLISFLTEAFAVLLFVLSRAFQARSDPPSLWRGYLALLMGFVLVVVYLAGGILLRLLMHGQLHLPTGTYGLFYQRGLLFLCLSALLYGMLQVLHPVMATLLPNTKERQVVAALAHCYGKSSISYFALGEDKSYFFSASGKSVISYVLEGNVAVVAGDPIGPEEEMRPVLEQFFAFCQRQDWLPVFWQVREELADLYRQVGLHFLKIGEDAVIDAQRFTLKGGAMANVRSSAKRAEKDGVRVIFYQGQIENAEQLFQMQMISCAWLENKGGSEMGFSMGHFDMRIDEEQISALAVDNTNRVHAFVTFVPIYGREGWGLDLMRRAERCAPGTMELLLACSINHLKERGAEMVSLGLAPLSNVNHTTETLLDSSIDFLTHRFGNLRQSESLLKFKQKFQPRWESRYLAYAHKLTLPKVGLALYAAHQRDMSWLTTLRQSLKVWQRERRTAQEGKVGKPEHTEPRRHQATGELAM